VTAERDLELDAKLALLLGWKLWEEKPLRPREPVQSLHFGQPSRPFQERYAQASDLDWSRLDSSTVPTLSADPAQVVERMTEMGWAYDSWGGAGRGHSAAFLRKVPKEQGRYKLAGESRDEPSFALAIALAALAALEAEGRPEVPK
jgi:hypothetical protein